MPDFMSGATLTTILPPRAWVQLIYTTSATPGEATLLSDVSIPFTKAILRAKDDNAADVIFGPDDAEQTFPISAGTPWVVDDANGYTDLNQLYVSSAAASQVLKIQYHPL